ncbi:ankyrin repeat domain-containing protein 31 [Notamacropus eugenii]|uniref:ankyrin repeat domain-containing protein 31 n=1 Tax=Notamacropus eugenii TaxID=9315 RepID=UPI003B672E9F
MNKHMINPLCEGGSETELSQALTQDVMDYPLFPEEGARDDQEPDSKWQNEHGCPAEDLGFLQRPEKELSDGDDSPEISLLSGAVITSYGTVEVRKKSSEKLEGYGVLSEPLKKVALPSREVRGEDSSCEVLVPTTEDSTRLSESLLGEHPFIVNEFETKELLKPLSDLDSPESMSPLDHLLICQEDSLSEDMQENEKNNALPAELLTALNTLSESMVQSICQRMEGSIRLWDEDECLGTEPSVSQTNDDCTQIAGMNFEFQHSIQPLGQDSKLTEPLFKDTTMKQDKEDPNSFGQEALAHHNVACLDGLSKERDLNSVETNTVMEASYMLRRSARLNTVRAGATPKNIEEACKIAEETLQKTDSARPAECFRTQDSAFQNNSGEKLVESSKKQVLSAYSWDEQIRKRTPKTRKRQRNTTKLSSINRRDIYGESPLHKAAQVDDSALVKKYIKLGGNVNLADYAGWTALHEASVQGFYKTALELLKGGADVNCKGMKQITPIYDAVLNGHYKVAELLLQNGADPLLRNDYGKCALDEADDPQMKQLLEYYVHKPRRSPAAEQRSRSGLSDPGDTHQHEKPEPSPGSTQYFNKESSGGIDDRKTEVSKRNKGNLLKDEGAVSVNHKKISKSKTLITTGNKQTTVDQMNAKEPPKINMQDVREPKNSVPVRERRSRTIPRRTETTVRKSNTRAPVAASSKTATSVAHRQQDPEAFCDLSEKSGTLAHSVTPVLKSHLCHDSDVFSVSKGRGACENDTTSLTLMSREEPEQSTRSADGQKEASVLELEPAEPAQAILLSGPPSCEEANLPLATEGNDHTVHHEKPVPCEAGACNNPNQKRESVTTWENSFPDRNVDSDSNNNDDGDGGCLSEGTILPKKKICLVNDENQSNCKANSEHEEESSSQHCLSSETQSLLQENVFQAGNLLTISHQDTVNLSDSDCTIISERYVVNDGQNVKRITSDVNPEQIPLTTSGTPSMPDLSGQISGVEISTSLHKNHTIVPSFVRQTDEERMTNERGKESSERTCSEKTQEGHQKSTECAGQSHEKEATRMEIKQAELAERDVIPNKNIQSPKSMNEDLRDTSQLRQGTEKITPSQSVFFCFSDKDMTDNVNREQNTERSHKEAREKKNPDTHVPRNLQQHEKRVQIKRKRQDLQEATCSQDVSSSLSTKKDLQNLSQQEDSPDPKASEIPEPSAFGKEDTQVLPDRPSCRTVTEVHKRSAKGKSRLHLAARRGNLSLVKALLESGARLNQKDNAGWTALHEAADKGFSEVMVELLKAGANVNSESLGGLLPIHNAVSGNHLKAAEILLQHGADPHRRDGCQKSAVDRAEDESMKNLLSSYSGNEMREISHSKVTAEKLSSRLKRQKQESCCNSKRADPLSFSHRDLTKERAPVHESICTILQDIEEKQESLLVFEIRTPKDADQYSEKMLQIKDIMDSVLAKQKKERDDLAKKYRASVESFKQGALREQLANLATRQKSLLMVAQKQKKLSQKIQNYKNIRNRSDLGVRGESPDSRDYSENEEGSYPNPVERTGQPDSVSVPMGSPASPPRGSGQKTHCSAESRQEDNQNLDSCMSESGVHEKATEKEWFSFNELISQGRPGDPTLERASKSGCAHSSERVRFPPQPATSRAPAEYLQDGSYSAVITAKGSKSLNPPAITGTLSVLETTSPTVRSNTHQPGSVCQPTLTSCLLPANMAKKTVSQEPPRAASESLVQSFLIHQANTRVDHGLRMKPNPTESRAIGALTDNSQVNFSSESANQNNKQEPLNHRAEMKMKKAQIKELISLGRIKPGNDVLEFKMQDATYKASILLNGKIKAKNGEIYQNPVTWIKALLGSNISVTWKYVWNKVTYLGKELCKYITGEVPIIAEPNVVLQENQPCLPGPSSDSVQNFTHYLQPNEVLLISSQELLPCHIMDQHWKFYMASKDGPF